MPVLLLLQSISRSILQLCNNTTVPTYTWTYSYTYILFLVYVFECFNPLCAHCSTAELARRRLRSRVDLLKTPAPNTNARNRKQKNNKKRAATTDASSGLRRIAALPRHQSQPRNGKKAGRRQGGQAKSNRCRLRRRWFRRVIRRKGATLTKNLRTSSCWRPSGPFRPRWMTFRSSPLSRCVQQYIHWFCTVALLLPL